MQIIRKYREFMGLRQVDLAEKLHVGRNLINNIEYGRSSLTLDLAKKIYDVLGIDEYRLTVDVESREKKDIVSLLYILTRAGEITWKDISEMEESKQLKIHCAVSKLREFNFYEKEEIEFSVSETQICENKKAYVSEIEGNYYVLNAFESKLSTVDWVLIRISTQENKTTVRLINSCLINDDIRDLLRVINNNKKGLSQDITSLLHCVQ